MQAEGTRTPDWYDDPERPGGLRYWDGSAWTDHRAERVPEDAAAPLSATAAATKSEKPAQQKTPKQPKPEGEDASFPLVVTAVLGSAVALIAFIVLVVVWFDSYNTGHARGEQALEQGVSSGDAEAYCNATAKDVAKPGSAEGYWDLPWIWGCKRGLG